MRPLLSRLDVPPPPPPPPLLAVLGGVTTTASATMPQLFHDVQNERTSSTSSSATIAIIVIASALVLSSSLYLLLRWLARRFHFPLLRESSTVDDVVFPSRNYLHDSRSESCLSDSLPLFRFSALTGNIANGGDCAVCLSSFEANDQLRLLPLCCHAFHADCIDAWLSSNQTCPLCRSSVQPTESDILDKLLSSEERGNSFRVEIGTVSIRRQSETDSVDNRSSYSIGSFDYVVDAGHEVSVGSTTHRRGISVDKESVGIPASVPASGPPVANLVADVSGRNWLRDYVDRLASISSRTSSFRSSGRYFVGSSRRSGSVVSSVDLEAGGMGEDISEFFRWLSGV